ncbi:hypothetical protein HDR58_09620 [bacterium]|nr:hypothetical protein [bacterium]
MKKIWKVPLILILVVFCILNMKATVFAGEIESAVGDCRLTFSLTDKTNGAFMDEIAVTLLNTDTSLEYNYTITSGDYLIGIPVGGNVKQGNYSIAISYASKGQGQFVVQNADGTEISSFIADSTEHTFDWVVCSNEGTDLLTPEMQESVEQGNIAEDSYTIGTGIDEADRLWEAFLEAVAPIENDNTYSPILQVIQNTSEFYAGYYESATGNSKDEYLDMTTFEQFLWYSTYILPVNAINSGDYNTYCSTVDNWNTYAVYQPHYMLSTYGTTEMADAYRALMEWDYQYFIEHGTVINFLSGNASLTDDQDNQDIIPSSEEVPEKVQTEQPAEKEVIESSVKEESRGEEKKEEKGIWDKTIAGIKNSVLTIVILLILSGATIAVIVYRKSKAIDDDAQ